MFAKSSSVARNELLTRSGGTSPSLSVTVSVPFPSFSTMKSGVISCAAFEAVSLSALPGLGLRRCISVRIFSIVGASTPKRWRILSQRLCMKSS